VHSSMVHTPAQFRLSPAHRVQVAGAGIVRWSIVLLLLFFGVLKWTAGEAWVAVQSQGLKGQP